ncbi:MAG: tetratricopeptide repeat protein [Undibacterium curvum]|uniref:tetratricopeptide repeat protein n=1 Tax=Undibacterium curvum TaxID=2762294 RepID=UPI003BD9A7D3
MTYLSLTSGWHIMNKLTLKPILLAAALCAAGFSLHLAHAYSFDDGVALYEEQDFPEAAAAFLEAAEEGNADAQFNLGLMYLNAEGVDEDYEQAFAWFSKSAEQNNPRAQTNLARMYAKGKGVRPDYDAAVTWFNKAAEQNYPDAQYSLGVLYVTGNGVPRDYNKARDLFQKAADQGNASAQYQLGLMYFKGKGMEVNQVEGYKWMELAGDYSDAVVFREFAQQSMSAADVEKAAELAEEWKASLEENS